MCYLRVVCEYNGEKIGVERTLTNTFTNNNGDGVIEEVKFVLGNILYGIEVQNHWFVTDEIFNILKQDMEETGKAPKEDAATTLYEGYIYGVYFSIKHLYKSSIL